MTRALYRSRPPERPPNEYIEAAFEELAMRSDEDVRDYQVGYDPLPFDLCAHGRDCFGASLPPPAGRGW